jgi:hypothetical protein
MPTPKNHRFQGKVPSTLLTGIIGASIVAATLTACDGGGASAGPQWVGMCVDSLTGMRVDDYQCGLPSQIYTEDWIDTYAYPTYGFAPVGHRVNITNVTVVNNPPAGSSRSTSLPSSGGTASSVRTSIAKVAPSGSSSVKSGASGTANSSGANSITRGGLGVKSGSSGGSAPRVGVSSGS